MNLTLHHGASEIGGNAVVLEAEGTRLLFDLGLPLEDDAQKRKKKVKTTLSSIPGLTKRARKPEIDAIFLSHAHPDHFGLMPKAHPEIPVYMGPGTKRILSVYGRYLRDSHEVEPWLESLENNGRLETIAPYKKHIVGPFWIYPIPVDHSAFDAYAFHVTVYGRRFFYTGDLRAHGRKKRQCWDKVLNFLKKHPVDYIVCEGTTLSRSKSTPPETEQELEKRVVNEIRQTRGLVQLQFSAANVDRFVTFIRAAIKTNRKFIIDPYTAYLLRLIAPAHSNDSHKWKPKIPNERNEIFRIFYRKVKRDPTPKRMRANLRKRAITADEINQSPGKFIMLTRPSYLKAPEFQAINCADGLLIYSYWHGYREKEDQIEFETYLSEKGTPLKQMHTSGHIAKSDLKTLIRAAQPKTLIPIHTTEPEEFHNIIPQNTKVIQARNGRPIRID